ncbi:MAG: preprotein translocase subunit YajC [bacterium]
MLVSLLYAEAQAAQGAPQAGSGLMNFVPLIVIFAIFYFLIIRPQQKKSKDHQEMLSQIQKGDQVLTNGGIYGTVAALRGNVVELKVADDVKIRVAKHAISTTVKDQANIQEVNQAEVLKQ